MSLSSVIQCLTSRLFCSPSIVNHAQKMDEKSSLFPSLEAAKSNPERLTLLYSPFRSRTLNPEHYDQKLKFWIRVIDEYGTCGQRITCTVKELQKAFVAPDGKVPTCLVDVIEHLRRSVVVVAMPYNYKSYAY